MEKYELTLVESPWTNEKQELKDKCFLLLFPCPAWYFYQVGLDLKTRTFAAWRELTCFGIECKKHTPSDKVSKSSTLCGKGVEKTATLLALDCSPLWEP